MSIWSSIVDVFSGGVEANRTPDFNPNAGSATVDTVLTRPEGAEFGYGGAFDESIPPADQGVMPEMMSGAVGALNNLPTNTTKLAAPGQFGGGSMAPQGLLGAYAQPQFQPIQSPRGLLTMPQYNFRR